MLTAVDTNTSKPTIERLVQVLAYDLAAIVEHPDTPAPLLDEIIKFAERIEQNEETTLEHSLRGKAAEIRASFPHYVAGIVAQYKTEVATAEANVAARKEVA
jgi:hypothetical protein